MRFSYTFKVDKPSELSKLLLFKSKSLSYISVLDSNIQVGQLSLPKDYIIYDLIAGVDALEVLDVENDSFNALQNFHAQHKDWMFGYLSYDLKNEVEKLNSDNNDGIKAANLSFFIPKYVLLLKGNTLEVQTYESEENCQQFLLHQQLSLLDNGSSIQLKKRDTKAKYIQKIDAIKKHIQRGDIYEVNYCQEFFAEDVVVSPQAIFQELNKNTNTPFASFLKLNDLHAMCASPERFIKKSGNEIISQPIKGTAKRSEIPEEDAQLKYNLEHDIKERSENIMIVDLVRNDLSKTATKGSVQVPELCKIYSFDQVHQMISTVTSEVEHTKSPVEIIRTTYPMGSMTGAPKVSAMKIIEELEETKRSVYSGAVGYFTPENDFDFNVIIRSILYNESNKYVSYSVGGAITAKANAEAEYQECLIKAKAMREALLS